MNRRKLIRENDIRESAVLSGDGHDLAERRDTLPVHSIWCIGMFLSRVGAGPRLRCPAQGMEDKTYYRSPKVCPAATVNCDMVVMLLKRKTAHCNMVPHMPYQLTPDFFNLPPKSCFVFFL